VRPSSVTVLRAGLVLALAAGALAAGGCAASPSPRCPPGASCPPIPLRVAFVPAVNGVSFAPRKDGHIPRFRVSPGEHLVIRVAVTVPRHVMLTALWFGISTGTWGSGPHGPTGMNPVLARYALPLPAGPHTFGLTWRVPRRRGSGSVILAYAWSSHQPDARAEGPIATLALPQRVNRQLSWGGGLAS
jgi:hypothetical protein